jgi:hypothetical protein
MGTNLSDDIDNTSGGPVLRGESRAALHLFLRQVFFDGA